MRGKDGAGGGGMDRGMVLDWGKIGEIKKKNKKGGMRSSVNTRSFFPPFPPPFFCSSVFHEGPLLFYAHEIVEFPLPPPILYFQQRFLPDIEIDPREGRGDTSRWKRNRLFVTNQPPRLSATLPILFQRQKFSCPPSQLANKQRSRRIYAGASVDRAAFEPRFTAREVGKEKRKGKMERRNNKCSVLPSVQTLRNLYFQFEQ